MNQSTSGNPVIPVYAADPDAHLIGDRYYIYATNAGFYANRGAFERGTAQETAHGFVNASLGRDGIDRMLIVTAEHNNLCYAHRMQPLQRLRHLRPHGIADGENAQHFTRALIVRQMA